MREVETRTRACHPRKLHPQMYSQFSLTQSANCQSEGLKSKNHCFSYPLKCPSRFKAPGGLAICSRSFLWKRTVCNLSSHRDSFSNLGSPESRFLLPPPLNSEPRRGVPQNVSCITTLLVRALRHPHWFRARFEKRLRHTDHFGTPLLWSKLYYITIYYTRLD